MDDIRSTIRIKPDLYEKYKELKKAFGYTILDIFTIGIHTAYKSVEAKKKYALENDSIIGFQVCKGYLARVDTYPPIQGHFQIIYIKNIEKLSLNKVNVYYNLYQFDKSKIVKRSKEYHISKVSKELLNIFI